MTTERFTQLTGLHPFYNEFNEEKPDEIISIRCSHKQLEEALHWADGFINMATNEHIFFSRGKIESELNSFENESTEQ